jgi:DNA-binding NarL/FixJ family response regulator
VKHLLVVDDHDAFVRALGRMLDESIVVTIVGTFEAARAAVDGGLGFDAALVNSHLPDGTAIALLAQTKKARPEALRILTSTDFKGDALALLHGDLVDAYLAKPFTYEALGRAFARARGAR